VDPAHARVLLQNLSDEGLPVFVHPQSAVIMSEATGNLVRAVNGEMIRHDGDPVLRQHFDNVAVSTNPQSGLVRMHKQRSNGRIDAAVASAMAVSRAVTAHDKRSRYDDPEVLGLTVF
jgi:phage terminase large subunit-like protein